MQPVFVITARCLMAAIIAGMVLFSGCIQDKDTPRVPEYPAPSIVPPTQSIAVTATPVPAGGQAAGPVPFVPGGTYRKGDQILITGTTILSPGNPLLIEVRSVAFGPTNKTDQAYFSGTTSVVEVMKGTTEGQNTWGYLVNTSDFAPGEYTIEITGLKVTGFRKTAAFTLNT